MNEDQQRRKTEFDKLFESLPGKNIERLRSVADALCCPLNTVRIYRLKAPTRIIPASKLQILQRHFQKKTG